LCPDAFASFHNDLKRIIIRFSDQNSEIKIKKDNGRMIGM
jgi:hypothetical protein